MFITELSKLPVIDIEYGKKILGNNETIIKDVLLLLINLLPDELEKIKLSYKKQQYGHLLTAIHRLHGAVCYSPTPRLKLVLSLLETELKNNIIDRLPLLLDTLEHETKEVMDTKDTL